MLLKGATLATIDPPLVEKADLRVEGDRIVDRGALCAGDGEKVVDLTDRLILPGLVNAHTHLYSTLSRGMPGPKAHPRRFLEILEQIWWRLDRALDEESVYVSGLIGGIEAVRSGTTVLLDHHSSPSFIRGSLATLRRALEEVGLRSVLCYEVSDRNGEQGRDLGLEENVVFQKSHQSDLTRGMVGGHASFTLSDASLDGLAEAVRATGSSLHIHVGEDKLDVEDCQRKHRVSLSERLLRHELIMSRTILAHCVHLDPLQVEAIAAHGGWVAHNPRSNMNNSVGYTSAGSLKRAALGTDGMDQDMFAEAHAAYLKMRDTGQRGAIPTTMQLLAGGHRLAAALFGLPFGKLAAGGPADLVVLDYASPTPLHTGNLPAHIVFGMDRSHVSSVMVAGRFVVHERQLTGLDLGAALERARKTAAALWQRMEQY